MDLREYLKNSILIGDGAMATQLYQLGVPVGTCYQELCLTNPRLIRSVHEAYINAGAQIIETNTFGVNREALERYGLEHKVKDINKAAVAIVKEAIQVTQAEKVFVVGSISSILAGRVSNQALEIYRDQYEEQGNALLEAGVHGIVLETFVDLEELLIALEVVRTLTDLPIFAQLATLQVGRTRDGYTVSNAFRHLVQAGADIVGLNCRLGPAEMLRTFETSIIPETAITSVFPNAGRLGMDDGEYAYKSSPEYFAESALRFREQGVKVIGGCCGTTPEHIRQIANALKGLEPIPRVNLAISIEEINSEPIFRPRKSETILDLVEKRPTVLVEFDPPKDLDTESFLRGCYEIHKSGADVITLADNSLANVRISNMAVGALMKERYGITPLLHVACRDRNLIGQQSHLMGLHALGIDQILVITGDPSRFGDLPGSSSVFDVSSFDLIKLTKQLNQGISFSGQPLNQKAEFVVGTAFNPYVRNFDSAIARLERKVASGADFIMTQPVYDEKTIEQIYESTAHIGVPIFIGIMPLTSQRNADFLHNEVPGIKLSDEALARMRGLKGAEARREGIVLCQELINITLKYFNGIYLITPFNYYEMTAELTRYVHSIEDKVLKKPSIK